MATLIEDAPSEATILVEEDEIWEAPAILVDATRWFDLNYEESRFVS